ncbi:MAG: Vps62-related protein [Clostridia bacterium]|nr:Vps62-related protein [Clostridia bacterium]
MKKALKVMITVVMLVAVAALADFSASALSYDSALQYQTESKVTLWSKKEYKGESKELGIGEYPSVDFRAGSITVPQEYAVYAYSEENFGGEEYFLNDSVDKLFSINIHNGITYYKNFKSFKVGLIESEAIDITKLSDSKKNRIMTDYAPRIHMAQGDPYEAVSMDWTFEHFDRVMDSEGKSRIVMKEKIDGPFDICETFYGDQDSAAAYAFWVEKDNDYVDIVYFVYCSYDSGKHIWLINSMVGGHPGDWEHFTLRFLTYEENGKKYMRPVKTAFAAHTFAEIETWEDLEMYDDTHCTIYCAAGTHGLYPHTGTYTYMNFVVVQLKDECSKGKEWDLWLPEKLETFELVPEESCRALAGSKWAEAFSYDVENPDSLATLYWGNESSYPPFMNGGPQGPQFKTEMTSKTSFK